jgi:aspartyl-tRNA(Asn)/glutamyl-tRNA(Gln) amidotransferase subunit B
VQETRLYDPDAQETRPMRSKEEANDYRYFPDPDLLPVSIDAELVARVRASLPELPDAKRERFIRDYALPAYDAGVLTVERALAEYFEAVAKATKAAPKIAANWVMGEVMGALNRSGIAIADARVTAPVLAELLDAIEGKKISGKQAKEVFEGLWELDVRQRTGASAVDEIIEKRGLTQISDSASIDKLVADVIAANPAQVEQFRAGKQQVLGFLVGQVMKASRGKANPQQVNEALRKQLGGS